LSFSFLKALLKVRFNASLLRPLADDDEQQHSVSGPAPASSLRELHQLTVAALQANNNPPVAAAHANREQVGFAVGGGVSIKRGKVTFLILFRFDC
jgi:hypothetical protein